MLKIGVLGAGHLGRIHINILKDIDEYELVGFYDLDIQRATAVSLELNVPFFNNLNQLFDSVDVIDIVTPTLSHYECALMAIERGKHFFVEKPLTNTVEEAKELLQKVEQAGVKAQVGHVERFNPAMLALKEFELAPIFIEGHRLAEFKPRGTDVSVVLDLMIHDIDIVLSLIKSPVAHLSASGVAIVSDTVDIANARIEFENGSVANLTSSRMSLKTERKLRIFQRNAYVTLDFFKKEANIFQMRELQPGEESESEIVIDRGDDRNKIEIFYSRPDTPEVNAIKYELQLFAKSIIDDTIPSVSIADGYRSLKLAHEIIDKINISIQKSNLS